LKLFTCKNSAGIKKALSKLEKKWSNGATKDKKPGDAEKKKFPVNYLEIACGRFKGSYIHMIHGCLDHL
jgi:hypothetical protein